MLWDITAIIGYLFLCWFAFIGLTFTIRAWVFAAELAVQKYKHDKIKDATAETALNIILTQEEKRKAEEYQNQQNKNK